MHKEKQNLVKRICTYPLSISQAPNSAANNSGRSHFAVDSASQPYAEYESTQMAHLLGSKNMMAGK